MPNETFQRKVELVLATPVASPDFSKKSGVGACDAGGFIRNF